MKYLALSIFSGILGAIICYVVLSFGSIGTDTLNKSHEAKIDSLQGLINEYKVATNLLKIKGVQLEDELKNKKGSIQIIKQRYEIYKINVSNLNADSSINLFSKYLSKENSH